MKRLVSMITAVFLLAILIVPASAADDPEYCVYDVAELLTDDEYWTLEDYAQEISEVQQCAVYFVTVEDYRDYGDGDIYNVARQIFLANEFGMGEDGDGVMLILSMDDRDYCLLAHGFGDTALTDYGKDYISGEFLDNFADNDWYGGCLDYLARTDELLAQARAGNIYDRGNWITSGALWLWSLVLGAAIAAIVCLIQRAAMKKKVRLQTGALGYLEGGSVNITRRRDVYTHSTEIRQKIETDKGPSGSSGGHSHSSDSFSGKSGKF
ncbi:MAG: TPM domain-containing protein [Eubacteriales bacterium]|nr:TPM domain-containing protein [Eubacteriales bacterium]